jgi:hypothetical protein
MFFIKNREINHIIFATNEKTSPPKVRETRGLFAWWGK